MKKYFLTQAIGKFKVGDIIRNGEAKVVEIGKTFTRFVPDEDTSVWGLMPGDDYYIDLQSIFYEEVKPR
jgi:hypothetical protein